MKHTTQYVFLASSRPTTRQTTTTQQSTCYTSTLSSSECGPHYRTMSRDTRCYFNVRSKADIIGLIYRTETTTKNCKTEKLKSKSRYVRNNGKILRNHVPSSEEEKQIVQWEGFAEKEGFKSGMKERVGDEKLIIMTNKCNCNGHK